MTFTPSMQNFLGALVIAFGAGLDAKIFLQQNRHDSEEAEATANFSSLG